MEEFLHNTALLKEEEKAFESASFGMGLCCMIQKLYVGCQQAIHFRNHDEMELTSTMVVIDMTSYIHRKRFINTFYIPDQTTGTSRCAEITMRRIPDLAGCASV